MSLQAMNDNEPVDWKFACLMSLKLLHQALDLIDEIDNELILHGRLKDLADAVLAARPPR